MELKNNLEEKETVEKGVPVEEKQELMSAWSFLVGKDMDNSKLEEKDIDELKKDMYDSMMEKMEEIACEWGLWPKDKMVKKMVLESDIEKKAGMERVYLQELKSMVEKFKQDFKRDPGNKWDSWPSRIRERKEFNCVGATLLGEVVLRRAGIESYYGNPHEHVVNIVHLSNGDWYYYDLNNAIPLLKLDPEEVELAGRKTLKINTGRIDYRFIPLAPIEDSAGSILANFAFLIKSARKAKQGDDTPENIEAQNYLDSAGRKFDSEKLMNTWETMYPDFIAVEKTDEMQNEIKRLDIIHEFQEAANSYANGLDFESREVLVKEIVKNNDGIIELIENNNEAVISDSSPELVEFLDIIVKSLEKYREDEEAYSLLKQNVLDRMARAKNVNV